MKKTKENLIKIEGKDYVTLDVIEVLHETDSAVLFEHESGRKWVPKSQLEDWPEIGDPGEIIITEWWATEKEWI